MSGYETMPAGPELDRLVAERVMGWGPCTGVDLEQWHPSTDIAHAWEVVERVRGGIGFSIQRCEMLGWLCWFRSASDNVARADTAPLAICRAALLALIAD